MIEIISEDCKVLTPEFLKETKMEDKPAYLEKFLKEKLEGMLERVHKNCYKSLSTNEWVAGPNVSFADVYLCAWMSIWCYGPLIKQYTAETLKKFPLLTKHYQKMLSHNNGRVQRHIA